jgi:hypothetical protein
MKESTKPTLLKQLLTIAISLIWLINGLFCKVLGLVPRHQFIVARILGQSHALLLTKAIGLSELCMFIWIISRVKSRFCALAQIGLVALMNTLEFILAPDLLLFGRANALVAFIFICVIVFNEFIIGRKGVRALD